MSALLFDSALIVYRLGSSTSPPTSTRLCSCQLSGWSSVAYSIVTSEITSDTFVVSYCRQLLRDQSHRRLLDRPQLQFRELLLSAPSWLASSSSAGSSSATIWSAVLHRPQFQSSSFSSHDRRLLYFCIYFCICGWLRSTSYFVRNCPNILFVRLSLYYVTSCLILCDPDDHRYITYSDFAH